MAEVEECTHDCNTCGVSCSSREGGAVQNLHEKLNKYSSVKKVIGIVSGKGGVGKSIVTSLMAVMFSRKGYHTAILDADIIPIFEWECQNNCVRSVEEYAAEAYTFWKAQ